MTGPPPWEMLRAIQLRPRPKTRADREREAEAGRHEVRQFLLLRGTIAVLEDWPPAPRN